MDYRRKRLRDGVSPKISVCASIISSVDTFVTDGKCLLPSISLYMVLLFRNISIALSLVFGETVEVGSGSRKEALAICCVVSGIGTGTEGLKAAEEIASSSMRQTPTQGRSIGKERKGKERLGEKAGAGARAGAAFQRERHLKICR